MSEAKPATTESTVAKLETKSVADMSPEEIQAETERVDAELAQAPMPPAPTSGASSDAGRAPSTSEARGETLAREVQAIRRDLLRQYESLDGEEKYTDEHKAEQAWAAYDKAKPLIEEKAKSARERLLESAQHLEHQSIPFPGGQSLRTDDVHLLTLTQGERARIVQRLSYEPPNVARMRAAGKNVPTSSEDKPRDVLRDEFSRALDIGGVQGGAICRAVISLAEDRGMSVDDIVDSHRRDWQRDYLQKAGEARIQARSLYSKVPLPSSKRPGGAQNLEEAAAGKRRTPFGTTKKSSSAGFESSFASKRKRPPWK